METRKQGIVLIVLFMAAITMIPFVSAVMVSAQPDLGTGLSETNIHADTSAPKLPTFMPSIKDQISYDEMQQLMKDYKPPVPIPESEIAHIILSKTWLLQNDKNQRGEMVELTFPKSWIDKPSVRDDEAVVLLRMPKKLLEQSDTNPDPQMITISCPETRFLEFSNLKLVNLTPQVQKITLKDESTESENMSIPTPLKSQTMFETTGIDRQVRGIFVRDTGYSVEALQGSMNPSSFSNKGETFLNYNEHEIYLDRSGDIIEFIIQFSDNGNTYGWVAVFDEGTWVTPWNWLNIDLTGKTPQLIDYELYLQSGGIYDVWLYDYYSGNWYGNNYNDVDNHGTRIDQIMGSTELDTVGGISKTFKTCARPWNDYSTRVGYTTWLTPQTTFDWSGYTPDEQYVYISAEFDEDGHIFTKHYTGNKY